MYFQFVGKIPILAGMAQHVHLLADFSSLRSNTFIFTRSPPFVKPAAARQVLRLLFPLTCAPAAFL